MIIHYVFPENATLSDAKRSLKRINMVIDKVGTQYRINRPYAFTNKAKYYDKLEDAVREAHAWDGIKMVQGK